MEATHTESKLIEALRDVNTFYDVFDAIAGMHASVERQVRQHREHGAHSVANTTQDEADRLDNVLALFYDLEEERINTKGI